MKKSRKLRIMITGAGSVIGFDAVRMVRALPGIEAVIACNVSPEFAARGIADKVELSPDFYFDCTHTEEEFLSHLVDCAKRNGVDVIIPCSIFELRPLAYNVSRFEDIGVRLVIESPDAVDTFADKLQTSKRIQALNGFAPITEEIVEMDGFSIPPSLGFPFLIKPRYGYGSKAITIIRSEDDFRDWDQAKPDKRKPYVAQEYLPSDDRKYSCSILYDREGLVMSVMAILRNSVKGITLTATYSADCQPIEDYLRSVLGPRLGGKYCLNIQLRVENGEPTVFEVNPRFGASEAIRRLFGQDPYLELLSQYFPMEANAPPRRYGQAMRVYTEVFIPNAV